jgi:hypothetical protein
MRVMILPAVAAGALFLILAAKSAGRLPERRRLERALLTVPLGLALVVPLAIGAFAWPLAALALWFMWRKVIDPARDAQQTKKALTTAALAAALAAAFVSIARQFDHPVRLPSATLFQTGTADATTGVLVYAGADTVVIGLPEERGLTSYRRAHVARLVVGASLDRRPPRRSILSLALGGDRWAATPFELWCGGESYGWNRVNDLCRSQPQLVEGSATYRHKTGALRVWVHCPKNAADGCSGYLTLTTRKTFIIDDLSSRAPIQVGGVFFRLDADADVPVELTVHSELERCLRRAAASPVELSAVLSSDQAAEAPLNGEDGQTLRIDFGGRRTGPVGHCIAESEAPDRGSSKPREGRDGRDGDARRESGGGDTGTGARDDRRRGRADDTSRNGGDRSGSGAGASSGGSADDEATDDGGHGSEEGATGTDDSGGTVDGGNGSDGGGKPLPTVTPDVTPTLPATPPKPKDPVVIPDQSRVAE